jgi:hypothetical protein
MARVICVVQEKAGRLEDENANLILELKSKSLMHPSLHVDDHGHSDGGQGHKDRRNHCDRWS